jgi:hypothetical protein
MIRSSRWVGSWLCLGSNLWLGSRLRLIGGARRQASFQVFRQTVYPKVWSLH